MCLRHGPALGRLGQEALEGRIHSARLSAIVCWCFLQIWVPKGRMVMNHLARGSLLPEASGACVNMASDVHKDAFGPTPPGLSATDSETATVSRERRRVALAAKAAVAEISAALLERISSFEVKLDQVAVAQREMNIGFGETVQLKLDKVVEDAALLSRVNRLEVLLAGSSVVGPSLDVVLSKMLTTQQHAADALKAPEVGHISEQSEPEHSPMKIASSGGSLGEWHQTDLSNESFEINEFYNVQVHNMEVQTEPVARDEFSDLFGTVSFHKRIVDSMEASLHLTGTWSRLADAKLAQDRVARLRKLAAAPAKPSAMINRSYSLCSSDEGEEGDSDCVCTLEDGEYDLNVDAMIGDEEIDEEDPEVSSFVDAVADIFMDSSLQRGDKKAAIKK